MGDYDPTAGERHQEGLQRDFRLHQEATKPTEHQSQALFHNQFNYPTQLQRQSTSSNHGNYGSFAMASMAAALPQPAPMNMQQHSQYESDSSNVLSPAAVYQMHHAVQYPSQRGGQFDSHVLRSQPQQFVSSQLLSGQVQPSMTARHSGLSVQPQAPYPRMEFYGYGLGGPQYSPVDPRYGPHAFALGGSMTVDPSSFARRASETAPVPSFPRGPPRKPKQSGHALWVGNLPPAATVTDLKDHFSRDATRDIESLFLISKSNCAFVNYRTEAACIAAMNRFHDSRFHGVRLVCRLRRGSSASPNFPTAADSSIAACNLPDGLGTKAMLNVLPHEVPDGSHEGMSDDWPDGLSDGHPTPSNPVIVGQKRAGESNRTASDSGSSISGDSCKQKVPEKFFIVKSLTVQDLEASVRNGIWATQSHNEEGLNRAFDEAENVYLVFSANKSGEYFGYARMASAITGEPVNLSSLSEIEYTKSVGAPQSIPTPATESAPKGRIIDDSARGTIFWEADISDSDPESPTKESGEGNSGQNWGRQFKIEWVSTARLPFFRTRGLRNPWNANREVKIARDGTELEPSVGRRLVQMFARPPQAHSGVAMMSPAGVPYQY